MVVKTETRRMEFDEKWGKDYHSIVLCWQRNWDRIILFFDYLPEILKVIYAFHAIESVQMSLRKITKNRSSFPSDETLLKLFYLALQNISKKWIMFIWDWKAVLNRFTIQFDDRMPWQ
uniref:Mutator family transposase n=1 Tax=Candidatus Nitrotoga fabula TaxID=2182327 RepID=A0A2X0SCY9_9PROT